MLHFANKSSSYLLLVATGLLFALSACQQEVAGELPVVTPLPDTAMSQTTLRIATFNITMGFENQGELATALSQPDNERLNLVAAILQTVRPDILLLNEFDYDPQINAHELLNGFLENAADGREPIHYPYSYQGPTNTGMPSGLDIDGNGKTDGPGDGWGFGHFPGQYGMILLSRYPIDLQKARSFQKFRWAELPAANRPMKPDGTDFYTDDTWQQLRLSSKSHWDIPVQINGKVLHVLAFHPTPPVFDGPENRNGLRNFDEIRFWAEYLRPDSAARFIDDQGREGGLADDSRFVVLGDINADPHDGDSMPGASQLLLEHERINGKLAPISLGAIEASGSQGGLNVEQKGDPAYDTADFNDKFTGNLRADYVLPSNNLTVIDSGVFWPASHEAGHEWVSVSDHHLVWLDIRIGDEDS